MKRRKLWLQRRRNRRDTAVLGALLLGDIYTFDIWHRIGGNIGEIYLSLSRLEQLGLVWSDLVEALGFEPRKRYGITKRTLDKIHWESR